MNYLLPHIQRVPSRIVRDELAQEIAQKLGIDSAVLRQELRHAASTRSTAAVKAPAEAQVTDAEKILIRALASARQMQPNEEHLSARDGAEEEFDPARQAQFVLQNEACTAAWRPNRSPNPCSTQAAILPMFWKYPRTESDRRLLALILLKEDEELTAEVLEAAVRALRRIHLRRRQEEVQQELKKPGLAADKDRLRELLTELERISRALTDPESGRRWPEKRGKAENSMKQKALSPSKYLRELKIAASVARGMKRATDRRHSTYVLNSESLCEMHNPAVPTFPPFQELYHTLLRSGTKQF